MTLSIIQIILAVVIVICIMLQERSSGVSSFLAGGFDGGGYQTRRGLERVVFYTTIFSVVAFAGLALWQVVR